MIFAVGALVAALSAATAPAVSIDDPYAASRAIVADVQKIVTPRGVQDQFVATIGGIPQAVSVRGANRSNPIILFLHGGPGAVEMPMSWTFQRPWEDYFTVVQWDQRGAGKTYALSDPKAIAPTLTPDRYRDDAIELIELLRRKYGQRKIILMGHSWGSFLGLAVAKKRPDLLYGYVGVGQVIGWRENEKAGFDWTLAEARRRGDAKAVRALEAMQPYPRAGPLRIEDADGWRQFAIGYGSLAADRHDANFYFDATRLSPEYGPADRKAWSAGSEFTVETLWPRLGDLSFSKLDHLKVPIVLFLGRHDHTATSSVAAAWFGRLRAPSKKLVWFDHSAHLPMMEEPGKTFAALLQFVRPLAVSQKPK